MKTTQINFTDEQWERLDLAACRLGVSTADAIRLAVLNHSAWKAAVEGGAARRQAWKLDDIGVRLVG